MNKRAKAFEEAVASGKGREEAIKAIADYVKSMYGYDWYVKPFLEENITDARVRELIEHVKKMYYPQEDVYFRKANFVYRFFAPYLVDECCIVTRDMVTELLSLCGQVIAAAKESGVIDANDKIDEKYFYRQGYYDLSEEEQKKESERVKAENANMPMDWVKVAADLLPTQSGFFFGSTDYNIWYLEDILSCKKQFTKLLLNWKPNEVVYNIMSW